MEAPAAVRYNVIGVMSGSSLDGVDLAWCELRVEEGLWSFNIREARTVPYEPEFRTRLINAMSGSALELARLHRDLGDRIGSACKELLNGQRVDLIASHGHTVFHRPEEGLTTQIGCGARIAAATGITTVCDFRTMDVALGGQGAPMVPLGEKLLFPSYKAFLNIGGICNIAIHTADGIAGYDVCIGNQALNFLANEAGMAYDANGELARSGKVIPTLLEALNALPFHHQEPPRSLGREWFDEQVKPLIGVQEMTIADRLRTVVQHMADQLASALSSSAGKALVTGGGARNGLLVELLQERTGGRVVVPEPLTVDYKEALVFALLGVLRIRSEATSLASVTGAKLNSIGGSVYLAN